MNWPIPCARELNRVSGPIASGRNLLSRQISRVKNSTGRRASRAADSTSRQVGVVGADGICGRHVRGFGRYRPGQNAQRQANSQAKSRNKEEVETMHALLAADENRTLFRCPFADGKRATAALLIP